MAELSFLGKGWGFPIQFVSPQTGPVMVKGEEEVKQAIWLLISTLIGERMLHPKFGSGLSHFMFESGDIATLADLKEELAHVIQVGEPRIDLTDIVMNLVDMDTGQLAIDIQYIIRETNTRTNLVFPLYLKEVTEAIQ